MRIQRAMLFGLTLLVISGLWITPAAASNRLVVHEWGTFTVLQDDNGRPMGGINIDDEPLPKFVHNLDPYILHQSLSTQIYRMKSAPRQHPLVTLRLETPVIYFYPSPDRPIESVDVKVKLRGGWLTEFYPEAVADAPNLHEGRFNFGRLTPQTVGSLAWNNLRIDTHAAGPETDSHVWLAPRKPNSVSVTAESGESEKYLFYRGVGNFNAPLRVETKYPGNKVTLKSNFGEVLRPNEKATVGPLWLVHIRKDGSSAYRIISGIDATDDQDVELATVDRTFKESDFSQQNIDQLCAAMQPALVAQGLYADEATAMLDTWRRAYFKSPGLRLFFLVPRLWTDYYLPLKLSTPADIERVMVARIELVSPEQRRLLRELREAKPSDSRWIEGIGKSEAAQRFLAGRSDFGDLGVPIPRDFQTYLDLGRFRNALLLTEEKRHPNSTLTRFVDNYGLHEYRWSEVPAGEPSNK